MVVELGCRDEVRVVIQVRLGLTEVLRAKVRGQPCGWQEGEEGRDIPSRVLPLSPHSSRLRRCSGRKVDRSQGKNLVDKQGLGLFCSTVPILPKRQPRTQSPSLPVAWG